MKLPTPASLGMITSAACGPAPLPHGHAEDDLPRRGRVADGQRSADAETHPEGTGAKGFPKLVQADLVGPTSTNDYSEFLSPVVCQLHPPVATAGAHNP